MHRFHLPTDHCRTPQMRLVGREAHHAVHVLRLARGERVIVLDGAGQELHCEVGDARHEAVVLHVTARKEVPPLPYQITLLQALPKGRLFEDIVQKATELGVHRIVPLLTEHVVTRLDRENAEAKTAKWRQIAVEAIKQCGNPWLPIIEAPATPQAFVARQECFDLSLIAALQGNGRHPREAIQRFLAEHRRAPRSVSVWIGPEGDFTPAKVGLAESAGALPITLGRLVLRVETAALYCLSFLNYERAGPQP